jgi:DNA-binding NarL/FixJ family response regulator
MLNFLIADDHSIVITSLKINLKEKYSFCKISQANNGDEVLKNDFRY